MGIDGSGMRDVYKSFDRDPADLHWALDGKGIYFAAGDPGSVNLRSADLSGGVRDITPGAQVLSLPSVARTLVPVGTRSDPEHPPGLVRRDLRRGPSAAPPNTHN